MKNKLDPRQYNPYDLNSPSGNFDITQGVDFFDIVLRESLTGNFSITGSLQVDGEYIYTPDTSNDITLDDGSHVFGGINNTVTGSDNVIVGSSSSTIDGQNNLILGGATNNINGDYSVAIGSFIDIDRTGAVVLKDRDFGVREDNGDDTISLYFINGIFLNNKTYLNDELWITGGDFFGSGCNITTTDDLNVGGSGLFSGDINVLGNLYSDGLPLASEGDLEALTNSAVMTTGDYSMTGGLTLNSPVKMEPNPVPSSFDSTGISGHMLWDTGHLYVCTGWIGGGNSGWGRVALTW